MKGRTRTIPVSSDLASLETRKVFLATDQTDHLLSYFNMRPLVWTCIKDPMKYLCFFFFSCEEASYKKGWYTLKYSFLWVVIVMKMDGDLRLLPTLLPTLSAWPAEPHPV